MGQTQVDAAEDGEMAIFAHPLDVHYVCRGLTGWPKLYFQVWSQDMHGRNDICGYGFCHIPTSPGMFELDCPTWMPEVGRLLHCLPSYLLACKFAASLKLRL